MIVECDKTNKVEMINKTNIDIINIQRFFDEINLAVILFFTMYPPLTHNEIIVWIK